MNILAVKGNHDFGSNITTSSMSIDSLDVRSIDKWPGS